MEKTEMQEIREHVLEIAEAIKRLQQTMDAKIERLKAVIIAYLEAESSMSLATVRANLKAI